LIEGSVFLITGLQARTLIAGIHGDSLSDLAVSAAVVCAVVIVARFIWMFPATYLPRWLFPAVARADPSPPWQWPFALAFTGIRGTVSLAAALAIPLTTENGAFFPARDRILFLTFSVILVTLVGQGLMLPAVMRALGLANAGRRERHADRVEEATARRQAIEAAIERLNELATERDLTHDVMRALRTRLRDRLKHVEHRSAGDDDNEGFIEPHEELECILIEAERQRVNDLYRARKLKDEARRRIERELDLREAQLDSARGEE
jgi:monovalent cation/hydrogen antiporter